VWQMGLPGQTLKLRNKDGELQEIAFDDPNEAAHVSAVSFPGRNSARAWEAFAKGDTGKMT